MSARTQKLPPIVDLVLIPAANVLLAFLAAGLVVLAIGENPFKAVAIMLSGAFGDSEAIGYTLFYATDYIFAGLAVALAFHAGLFNIGGEGQAYLGGLGAGLVALALDHTGIGIFVIPAAILSAAAFGAAWAFVPAYLQAYRGSHIVITTIMFNFLAAALMTYLMVNVLIAPTSMSPESRDFLGAAQMPQIADMLKAVGWQVKDSPFNLASLLAGACCYGVWLLIWRTPWGYELRLLGFNANAATYAGVKAKRMIVIAMCLSGALAGMVGVNEVLGVHHRLLLDFALGYGFGGIAVALMGRNHPAGIVFAGLLFGALQQGGTELSFDMPQVTREMVIAIQGLVILFSGALAQMTRPWFEAPFGQLKRAMPEKEA
jgi:general nucleoside transport system permease protein